MSTFKKYSAYYDLLYLNKDYKSEVEYVHKLIKQNCSNATSLLNLGCGTGRHDAEFAKLGYDVAGVDLSQEMIEIAKQNNNSPKLEFQQGDIRSLRLNRKFDVVVSLFHVMSYQVTNEDISAAFETARFHLKEGGIFIFDCWYGPGVLTDQPATRVKRIENGDIQVLRIAEPLMHYDKNTVDVLYEIRVKEKKSGKEEVINEKHSVRYFFLPEISLFAGKFSKVNCYCWLTERTPETDWFIVSVFKNP